MSAKAASVGPSHADILSRYKDELNDRQLVIQGVFDDEIKRLQQAKADAEDKLGMVRTLGDAAKVKADADAYAASSKAQADSLLSTAKQALANANAKMDAALQKEKAVASREEQALSLMEDYQHKADAFDGQCAKREAGLKAREDALAKAQSDLSQQQTAWAEKQAKLSQALQAAKEMAVSVK